MFWAPQFQPTPTLTPDPEIPTPDPPPDTWEKRITRLAYRATRRIVAFHGEDILRLLKEHGFYRQTCLELEAECSRLRREVWDRDAVIARRPAIQGDKTT